MGTEGPVAPSYWKFQVSKIYFHSEASTVEVEGGQRAHIDLFIGDFFGATLQCLVEDDLPGAPSPLRKIVNYGYWMDNFRRDMPLALRSCTHEDLRFSIDGEEHPCFDVALNTALGVGNDSLRLLARIHAQCEIHAYCMGSNRRWLAGLISKGV